MSEGTDSRADISSGLVVPPEVAQRAVEWWLLSCEGEMSRSRRRNWMAWRNADPLHERAWRHIETVNARMAGLAGNTSQAALARVTLGRAGATSRRRAVKTLGVAFFGGGVAWQVEQHLPWRNWVADVRTASGERRSLVLDDGTQMVLNGASALDIGFSAQRRMLRLHKGEVLITTAKDGRQPARPFVVMTRGGEAEALGTRFVVRAEEGESALVSVFEGAVRLTPRAAGSTLVLQAGEQASFDAQGTSSASAVHEDSTAWVDGMLIARAMPLSDVLAALQPYSEARLVCEPRVAGLRISGTYPLADVPRVLAVLGALPQLRVRPLTRWWGRHEIVVETSD